MSFSHEYPHHVTVFCLQSKYTSFFQRSKRYPTCLSNSVLSIDRQARFILSQVPVNGLGDSYLAVQWPFVQVYSHPRLI